MLSDMHMHNLMKGHSRINSRSVIYLLEAVMQCDDHVSG